MHLKSFFSSVPNHDTLCGGACVFSPFPNFTARRTRIISFALLRKELKYPLNRKLCGPQSRYINLEEKKYLLPYPAVYLNFLSSSCQPGHYTCQIAIVIAAVIVIQSKVFITAIVTNTQPTEGEPHYIYCHHHQQQHHHNHHLAKMELRHLLIRSGRISLEVYLMVSPGSFRLLVCSFQYSQLSITGHSAYMLQPISSVTHIVQNLKYKSIKN